MNKKLLLWILVSLIAFWAHIFFLPFAGLAVPNITFIVLVFASRTLKPFQALVLGATVGGLLSVVSINPPIWLVLTAGATALLVRRLTESYFTQRAFHTTFLVFFLGGIVFWSPELIRAITAILRDSQPAISLASPILHATLHAIAAALLYIPLLFAASRYRTRLQRNTTLL